MILALKRLKQGAKKLGVILNHMVNLKAWAIQGLVSNVKKKKKVILYLVAVTTQSSIKIQMC